MLRRDSGFQDEEFSFDFPFPDEEPPAEPKRPKPARVRLAYRDRGQLVAEYRENLRRGVGLVRTGKPLAAGRECVLEVSGPGLDEPLVIPARVVRTQADGMEVEYDLDADGRRAMLAALRG